jgi:hypothetical protein
LSGARRGRISCHVLHVNGDQFVRDAIGALFKRLERWMRTSWTKFGDCCEAWLQPSSSR